MVNKVTGKAIGGKARAEKLSPERRKEIAQKAAKERWKSPNSNLMQATHQGELQIGDMKFPCSVLADGTRILTQSDFMSGMGMYYSGWIAKNRPFGQSADIPHFLAFKTLNPFISKHLGNLQSIVVKYKTQKGSVAHGVKAEIIPKICEVWLDADEKIKLPSRQKQIAEKAKILMRALAHVGIIALIDEATGYQAIRPQDALQKYLEIIVSKELAAWSKKYPDEFYENIYKLKGWPWPGIKKNRFSVVAHYTNDLVYERIAPGLKNELQTKSPKDEKGRRKNKLHQWLTEDIGNPMLSQHLHSIIMFQRLALSNGYGWKRFLNMVDRVLPKRGATLEIPFPEPE